MLRKLWKIAWISTLSFIGFIFIVGILASIFGSNEGEEKVSAPPHQQQAPTPKPAESKQFPEPAQPLPPPKSPFQQMADEAVAWVDAVDLIQQYQDNEIASDQKYKGETVVVRGYIYKLSDTYRGPEIQFVQSEYEIIFTLTCRIQRKQKPLLAQLSKGQDVLVVGKLTGFSGGMAFNIDMKNSLVALPK